MKAWAMLVAAVLAMAGTHSVCVSGPRIAPKTQFDTAIQPLLRRCLQCHGPDQAKAGLRLDTREAATKALRSGERAIAPGSPADSELLRRVCSTRRGERMPPQGPSLTAEQVDVLRGWIAEGAEWPPHWAYRPLCNVAVPSLQHVPAPLQDWPRTPIDRFLLQRLLDKGLTPAPVAEKRTLLRRVYFDLIGLPPTPGETAAFLADRAPDAYERVVDRLLASPAYGERWARHWMDIAHFAETHGHDQDRPREHAWPYRDYLIRSFNADKPYPRFVCEQIAGDVLWPDEADATIATGFLAAGPWDESSLRDIREDSIDREIGRMLDRDDIVTTVIGTFASTTIGCARCHDHKFDPIPQREYYRLQAVFAGVDKADRAFDADPWMGRRRRELVRRQAELALVGPLAKLAVWDLTQKVERDWRALPPLQFVYCGSNRFAPDGSFRPVDRPRAIHVLWRGDIRYPGAEVQPGALTCVPGLKADFALVNADDEGSRRAALARWLTDRHNGLAWRSIANRVWQYHFGRGLVDTPNDFGRLGSPPTHPELLDWLAVSLQKNGGSLKELHRLIVTSAVYRQAVVHNPQFAAFDADNRYLWRMNRRRLDAEEIHDTVLVAAGRLNRRMGGPSDREFILSPGVHVTPTVDYSKFDPEPPANYRRSVYRFLFRTLPDPFMEALDCPDGSQVTPLRNASVTALQALALLHDKFIIRQSQHLAERITTASGGAREQVQLLYSLLLGRAPTQREAALVGGYAKRHGLTNTCRMIINSNEFMFVD